MEEHPGLETGLTALIRGAHPGPTVALREAIDALPEKERMTILLRYFKGLTQEQTARILGVSQVQVSRLERRGLKRLREFLSP